MCFWVENLRRSSEFTDFPEWRYKIESRGRLGRSRRKHPYSEVYYVPGIFNVLPHLIRSLQRCHYSCFTVRKFRTRRLLKVTKLGRTRVKFWTLIFQFRALSGLYGHLNPVWGIKDTMLTVTPPCPWNVTYTSFWVQDLRIIGERNRKFLVPGRRNPVP